MKIKNIVVVVGLPGSGKSTAAKILAKRMKAAVVHSGDIIRAEIRRRGLPYTPKNDAAIARWFHSGRESLLTSRAWNVALKKASRKKTIIFEGFRSPLHIRYLQMLSGIRPIVIAITAPFTIRAKRELKRGRFGKSQTMSYLRKREMLETKHGVKRLISKADYKIDNSGDIEKLQTYLTKLSKKLNKDI
jgi:dephospho-CoA kinase